MAVSSYERVGGPPATAAAGEAEAHAPPGEAAGSDAGQQLAPEAHDEAGARDSSTPAPRMWRPILLCAAAAGAACAAWAASGHLLPAKPAGARLRAGAGGRASDPLSLYEMSRLNGPENYRPNATSGLSSCPERTDRGGMPRSTLYYTAEQAFKCLNTNGGDTIDFAELGYRATAPEDTVLSLGQFLDQVRLGRDRILEKATFEEAEVTRWSLQLLKVLPPELQQAVQDYVKDPGETIQSIYQLKGTRARRFERPGEVAAVYSYGSPAITMEGQLSNHRREDGCFPGVRTYMRGSEPIPYLGILFNKADPISWILTMFGFRHAKTTVLAVDEDSFTASEISHCGTEDHDGWLGPLPDLFFWFAGHSPSYIEWNLNQLLATVLGIEDTSKVARDMREAFSGTNRYNYYVGDMVTVSSNVDLVKAAMTKMALNWDDGVHLALLGKELSVQSVPHPGVLGLVDLSAGTSAEQVYFPMSVTESARRLAAEPAASEEEAKPRRLLTEDGEMLTAVAEYAPLAFSVYRPVPEVRSDSVFAYGDLGYRMIGRVKANYATASLFQDEDNKCVVAFGMLDPKEQTHLNVPTDWQSNDPDHPLGTDQGLVTPLYYWWIYLAGIEPQLNQLKNWHWKPWREFTRPYYQPMQEPAFLQSKSNQTWEDLTPVSNTTDFCGFPHVQDNHVLELTDLLQSKGWNEQLLKELPKCLDVTAVGHDLGGSLAYLWAACVNHDAEGPAHDASTWESSVPEQIAEWPTKEEQQATGPDGQPLPTLAEQKWTMTEAGKLKNEATGKCLVVVGEGAAADGSQAILQGCHSNVRFPDAHSLWEFGSKDGNHGLLSSKALSLCLLADTSVGRCLLSDQVWAWTTEGFIVNRKSGLCLGYDEETHNDKFGAKAVLQQCHYNSSTSPQLFEQTGDGFFRSIFKQKCLDVSNLHEEGEMSLVFWDCAPGDGGPNSQHFKVWELHHGSGHTGTTGLFLNELSQKCVDVRGDLAREGDTVQLWYCELTGLASNAKGQGRLWELTEAGQVVVLPFYPDYKSGCLTAHGTSGTVSLENCRLPAGGDGPGADPDRAGV